MAINSGAKIVALEDALPAQNAQQSLTNDQAP
jgi:hypothetical protein